MASRAEARLLATMASVREPRARLELVLKLDDVLGDVRRRVMAVGRELGDELGWRGEEVACVDR